MFWGETSDNAALVPFLPLRIRLARFWSKFSANFKADHKKTPKNSARNPARDPADRTD
ncbi:hypothetical protein [Kiloniella majae]|uniref:hypothetical protein n=1 Tax=Kiloniella majae TaxID=1938558 RepID=UPI0015C51B27|nr:hypothetical protein [Kiloniella majae]